MGPIRRVNRPDADQANALGGVEDQALIEYSIEEIHKLDEDTMRPFYSHE